MMNYYRKNSMFCNVSRHFVIKQEEKFVVVDRRKMCFFEIIANLFQRFLWMVLDFLTSCIKVWVISYNIQNNPSFLQEVIMIEFFVLFKATKTVCYKYMTRGKCL